MQTKHFKNFIRTKYVWPGGYPQFMIADDGEAVCHTCASKHAKQIIADTRSGSRSGWRCDVVAVNWEDSELRCAHCDALIESAYGE